MWTESRFTFKGYNFNPVCHPTGAVLHMRNIDASTGDVYQKQISGTGREELLVQGK
jgi:hypothetical protein